MPEARPLPFPRIGLIGGGLIGGSWALAIRAAYPSVHIQLFDQSDVHRDEAMACGMADLACNSLIEVIRDVDLVILAIPVGALFETFTQLAPLLGEHTVLTDVGSTKHSVIEAARHTLGAAFSRFVPGHPISGAEKSGPQAARADLFKDKRVVLTPTPETHPEAIEKVRLLWEKSGAEVKTLDAVQHDTVFAAVSHLPHLLSYALVDELAARSDAELVFSYAAGGFRDFTRIAASHPTMWRDISLANQAALLSELDAYINKLNELRGLLQSKDGAALLALYERAQKARTDWANRLS